MRLEIRLINIRPCSNGFTRWEPQKNFKISLTPSSFGLKERPGSSTRMLVPTYLDQTQTQTTFSTSHHRRHRHRQVFDVQSSALALPDSGLARGIPGLERCLRKVLVCRSVAPLLQSLYYYYSDHGWRGVLHFRRKMMIHEHDTEHDLNDFLLRALHNTRFPLYVEYVYSWHYGWAVYCVFYNTPYSKQ